MHAILVNSGGDSEALVNHDAAGGVGIENPPSLKTTFPPLTLLYIAAVLENEGIFVDFYDENLIQQKPIDSLKNGQLSSDVLIIQSAMTTVDYDVERIKELRDIRPNLKIISVGTFLEQFAPALLEAGVDVVISGTPEISIVSAVMDDVKGFVSATPTKDQLESLPYPAWHLVNIQNYTSFTILSSRGCSFGCIYCPYRTFQGDNIVARSPENTLAEIEWLCKEHRPDFLVFRDPLFTHDLERAKHIVRGIEQIAPDLEWACETRLELLSDDLIDLMANTNCHHVRMGIESARPDILVQAGRRKSVTQSKRYLDQASDTIQRLRKKGIRTLCFFMLGFPDDNEESAEAIIEFTKAADPDMALLSFTTPYPGTPLFDLASSDDLLETYDLSQYGTKATPIVRTNHLSNKQLTEIGYRLNEYFEQRNRGDINSYH